MTSARNRVCIGQLVRPDGTVLTEGFSTEMCGPTFGYSWANIYAPEFGTITGAAYGRWRYSDEDQWRVIYYWPNGPDDLPAFADHTGEGQFHSMNPDDPAMERDEVAQALKVVTGQVRL